MSGIMHSLRGSYRVAAAGGITFPITSPTTVSNAATVAQSPFSGGGNSYNFLGSTTSYITIAGNSGFAFGTGDFTIEWFQYETDSNNFPRVFWTNGTVSLGISLEISTAYFWSPSFISVGTISSYKNAWIHFALVRISGKLYLYKNGVLVTTAGGVTSTTNITNTTNTLYFGGKAAGGLASEQFGGYMTNIRICNIGVYRGNFTVPTSALQATQSANPYGGSNTLAILSGSTILLLVP